MRSKMPLILAGITVVFVVLGMLFTPAPDASAPSTTSRAEALTVAAVAPAKKTLTPEEVAKSEPDPPRSADSSSIPPGTKSVEAYWSGKWWPGTVLDHNAGQFRVHIYGDRGKIDATLWLAEHRVRLPQSVGPSASAMTIDGLPE